MRARVTTPAGAPRESRAEAGAVAWLADAVRHAVENLAEKPYESITVEFKPPRQ